MYLSLTLAWNDYIVASIGLASANSSFHCTGHAVMLGPTYPSVRL